MMSYDRFLDAEQSRYEYECERAANEDLCGRCVHLDAGRCELDRSPRGGECCEFKEQLDGVDR